MSIKFNYTKNNHIFINGDVTSRKEIFLHSLINIYVKREGINLMFSDPKKVELMEYKDISLSGRVSTNLEEFLFDFENFKKIKGNKILFINEIADYIRDKNSNKFYEILNNILN